jgi:RNA recognition motif-containing protein
VLILRRVLNSAGQFVFANRHLSESNVSAISGSGEFLLMSIYVGNLSYEVTQEDLTAIFAEYGSVKRVQLPTDRETGRMRGFGFVEMETDAEESAAIEALDGAEWMGRDLRVNKAKPREDNRGGGGGNRGGGRGSFSQRY